MKAKFKDFLTFKVIVDKTKLFQQKNKHRRFLPEKVPAHKWFQLDERSQMIIFPNYPCASGVSGAIRICFHPTHFAEYDIVWKWQYIHERGDALKLGKKPGLVFLKGDPLLLPKKHQGVIYSIIYFLSPTDYYFEETENEEFSVCI
jgi:hypothetical protein